MIFPIFSRFLYHILILCKLDNLILWDHNFHMVCILPCKRFQKIFHYSCSYAKIESNTIERFYLEQTIYTKPKKIIKYFDLNK